MYIWMDVRYMFVVMECKKSIKKGQLWSLCRVQHSARAPFAECNGHCTRQSWKTEAIFGHFPSFAECRRGTQQIISKKN
jgi:hypothetical protein